MAKQGIWQEDGKVLGVTSGKRERASEGDSVFSHLAF